MSPHMLGHLDLLETNCRVVVLFARLAEVLIDAGHFGSVTLAFTKFAVTPLDEFLVPLALPRVFIDVVMLRKGYLCVSER